MLCRQCVGKMEHTQGNTSYGTGEKIFRCIECGWTGVESACLKKIPETPKTKPEDMLYHGIKYLDYKAIITITGPNGKKRTEFTTWRADIITAMMEAGLVIQAFEPGDVFTVEATPNVKKPDEVNT